MTFDEVIVEINEQGWNLHALYQTDTIELSYHPTTPRWKCTLREIADKPRCNILHGSGIDPITAIHNAMGSASELERETAICEMLEHDDKPEIEHPKLKLSLDMIVKREPINRRL